MNSIENATLDVQTGWIILAIFSVFWIGLGAYLGRKNTGLESIMLAGRKVGLALGTATAMATWVTSNTAMVAPQLALQMGIWGMLGYSLGSVGLILFAPLAKRIHDLMPHAYTSGDFIRIRYGKFTWRVFLVISFCYSMGWLFSMVMAGGVLVNALTGIDYRIGMSVILWVCVTYTILGGLRAVIGTDFIQSIIIIFGVVLLAWLTLSEIGIEKIHSSVQEVRPELLNLLFPAAIMFLFNNLLFGIGEIFHSNVWWSRAFAFRKGVGFKAYLLAGIFWTPMPIVAGFVALAVPSLGINIPAGDMVGPLVAGKLLGGAGAVLVFIVVFSALASSLDSLLAATSDLVLNDFYKGHISPDASEEKLAKLAPYMVIGLGILAWLVCLPKLTTVATLLYFMGAFVASTIWPILAGLYWQRSNAMGAALAMISGTLIGIVCYFQIGFYVAAVVSAAVSMTVVIATTALMPGTFDWDRLAQQKEAI